MHPEAWEKEMSKLVNSALDGKQVGISIGGTNFVVTVASQSESRTAGLAGKESIPNDGMIFIYPGLHNAPFTMAEMLFPIQIYFFDAAGHIIHAEGSHSQLTVEPPESYRYVVELASNLIVDGELELLEVIDDE